MAPTFSKRETLLAFRAATSSTKGGPRLKISRNSSLFCESRGLSTPLAPAQHSLVHLPSPYLEVVADAGAQHLLKGLVGALACPAVQVHALQAKSDGLLLVLSTLSRERSISNNWGTSSMSPGSPQRGIMRQLGSSHTMAGQGTTRLRYLNETQDVSEDGSLPPSVCLGSVLVALSSQDLELGTQELCILVAQVLLPKSRRFRGMSSRHCPLPWAGQGRGITGASRSACVHAGDAGQRQLGQGMGRVSQQLPPCRPFSIHPLLPLPQPMLYLQVLGQFEEQCDGFPSQDAQGNIAAGQQWGQLQPATGTGRQEGSQGGQALPQGLPAPQLAASHQPPFTPHPTHLSKMLLRWEEGQMVRSRDHDWRALQCRGPCWAGAELPSPVLVGLKMPSKQDRHETRSWRRETCQSDHSCHEDATVSCALGTKWDPPCQGVPGAPLGQQRLLHPQHPISATQASLQLREGAWAVTDVPVPLL